MTTEGAAFPPRLVIAGVASGVGKTTIATALMAALVARGFRVQGFKVGPDYIDPTYHRAATGRPSYNLDTWLVQYPETDRRKRENLVQPATPHDMGDSTRSIPTRSSENAPGSLTLVRKRFDAAVRGADIAVIEGVMGLFDGRKKDLFVASTAEVARLLDAPIVLVLDASRMGQSAAAIVRGFQAIDARIRIAGVLLNKVASADHEATLRLAIAEWTGVPIYGVLRRDDGLTLPARHLGLVPAGETDVQVRRLGELITPSVDLDGIVALARAAGALPAQPPSDEQERGADMTLLPHGQRVKLGLAADEAFTFYYPETLELFETMGVEIMPFSPLHDDRLPANLDLLYFGGGFPEVFAPRLAANHAMLAAIRAAVRRGIPTYAECGGYMYLGQRLLDAQQVSHAMVGALPYSFQMGRKTARLGYRELVTLRDTLIGPAGTRLRGHEFHWSYLEGPFMEQHAPYQVIESANTKEGYATPTLLASYIHIPLAANPGVVSALLQKGRTYRGTKNSRSGAGKSSQPATDFSDGT